MKTPVVDRQEVRAALVAARRYLDRRLPQLDHLPATEGYGDPALVAAVRAVFEAFNAAIDTV